MRRARKKKKNLNCVLPGHFVAWTGPSSPAAAPKTSRAKVRSQKSRQEPDSRDPGNVLLPKKTNVFSFRNSKILHPELPSMRNSDWIDIDSMTNRLDLHGNHQAFLTELAVAAFKRSNFIHFQTLELDVFTIFQWFYIAIKIDTRLQQQGEDG